MARREELTTVDSWERLWVRRRSAALVRVKRRLGGTKAWHQLLTTFLDGVAGGRPVDVLELGCAPGSMLLELHRLRPDNSYRGVDLAPQGLAAARAALRSAGVAAKLHHGDVRDVVLDPADLVVSFGLVEHFADPAEIVRHHARLARPGGTVAVTVPNYGHPAVVALLRRFCPETLATHNTDVMSVESLRAAFTAAGLGRVRAGQAGGPVLPNSRVRGGAAGASYRLLSRGWNLCAYRLPSGRPWPAVLWATGVNVS